MNLFLLLATLAIASTSFAVDVAESDITFIPAFELQSAAVTKLEARDGLVNNILCAFLGVGITSGCQQYCPQGYTSNSQGYCVPYSYQYSNPYRCGGRYCPAPVNGAAACLNNQICGYYCPPNTNFNIQTTTCQYNTPTPPVQTLGTINDCAYVGNTCTTPFANSYPTCLSNNQGGYYCHASCYFGYRWNPQTAQCVGYAKRALKMHSVTK